MRVRVQICEDAAAVQPFADGLRAVEARITYPAGDDVFSIDHGADYAAFFRGLGEARFAVVTGATGEVVGGIAGVWRDAVGPDGSGLRSIYLADLKLSPEARGRGVPAKLLGRGFWEILRRPGWRDADLFFAAAMRGDRGDVTRSHRGLHVGRLGRPWARLGMWFVPPARLRDLPDGGPVFPGAGLDLSGGRPLPRVSRTTGRKDFRLRATGRPWPLAHISLSPADRTVPLGAHLRACAADLADDELATFAIDDRLTAHHQWLRDHGLPPDAAATVHGMPFSLRGWRAVRDARWIHLSTCEI